MTLNQLIREIRRTVSQHRQISSFHFGEIDEWNDAGSIVYPSCLVTMTDAMVLTNQCRVNFTIYIVDMLNDHNRLDAQSDSLQTLHDIFSDLQHPDLDWDFEAGDIMFIDDARGNDTPDRVGGVSASFSIRIPFIKDRCVIPMTEEVTGQPRTLNQVARLLTEIAVNNRLVNHVLLGEFHEWVENCPVYPSVLVTLNSAVSRPNQTEYRFSITIADKSSYSSRNDVTSDAMQILLDYLSAVETIDIDWMPNTEAQVDFISDELGNDTPDIVAGVKCDFSIRVDQPYDRCRVPRMSAIRTETGFDILTEDGEFIIEE